MAKAKAKAKAETNDSNSMIDAINKTLGIRAATTWGEAKKDRKWKGFASTGSAILDTIICNEKNVNYEGGVPFGGLTMIAGEEQSGKSLLGAHIAKSVLDMGGTCIFINREYGADFDFWERVGIDPKNPNMINVEISTIEQAFDAMDSAMKEISAKSMEKVAIIWDSVAATLVEEDLQQDLSDIGKRAIPRAPQVINQGIKRIISTVQKHAVALVFINQLRQKMNPSLYEDKWRIPGGQGLMHFCDLIIRLNRAGKQEESGERVATGVRVTITKNRVGPPLRRCHLDAYFGTGFREEVSFLDRLKEIEVVKKEKGKRNNMLVWSGGEETFTDKDWMRKLQDKDFFEWVRRTVVDSYIIDHAEEVELRNLVGKVDSNTGEILGDIDSFDKEETKEE